MLVVGTGAVATLLVERFDRFGLPFQIFGAPSDRLWALEARFPGRTTSRLEEIAYDEWLVALKTNQNEAKIRTLRGGRPRAILVLQNGLGPERQWATLSSQVGRALSTYGVKSIAPGRIEGGEFGEMTVVEGSPFFAPLSAAGFRVRMVGSMDGAIWRKLAVNASLNVVAALYGVENGRVLEIPEAFRLTRLASQEVEEVARASGVPWGSRSAWETTRSVARGTSRNICSTLGDIRAGRTTEYDAINGEVLAVADRLNLVVPTLRHLDIAFRDLVGQNLRTVCA